MLIDAGLFQPLTNAFASLNLQAMLNLKFHYHKLGAWKGTLKKALIFSLLIHFVFVWIGYDLGKLFELRLTNRAKEKQQSHPVSQLQVPKVRAKERYVPFAVSAKNDKEAAPNARFKSDKNQVVEKESMAQLQNSMGLGLSNSMPQPSNEKKEKSLLAEDSKKQTLPKPNSKQSNDKAMSDKKAGHKKESEKNTPSLKDLFLNNEPIFSAKNNDSTQNKREEEGEESGERSEQTENASDKDLMLRNRLNFSLPDSNEKAFYLPNSNLAMGNVTLLNTFYSESASFDRRVYEALLPVWNHEIYALPPNVTGNLLPGQYVSVLEVIIDHLGQIKTVEVLSPSGVKPLDLASYRAILKLQAFPNPPQIFKTAPDTYTLRFQFGLMVAGGGAGSGRRMR